jgi:hypothetical protein
MHMSERSRCDIASCSWKRTLADVLNGGFLVQIPVAGARAEAEFMKLW